MDDAMIDEERGCDPEAFPASDCGSPLALPYFISFTVIGTFVFLNLIVAVILENFTALGNVNGDLVSTNDIVEFKEIWGWYDPDADGMIPAKSLPLLVRDLPPPLGLKGTRSDSESKAFRFCLSLGLTQKNGEVGFKQTLDALIHRNYGEKKVKLDGGIGLKDGEAPPAVREVLMHRSKTISSIDITKMTKSPGKVDEPLTARRFEMSRILAEELLRMFIRRKRAEWETSGGPIAAPKSTPPPAAKPPPPAAKGKAPAAAPPRAQAPAAAKPASAAKGPPPKGGAASGKKPPAPGKR